MRTCVEAGIEVETLPGATAFVPALVNSGFPCDRFCFEGFLPVKKGRSSLLASLASEPRTMVFYESPRRLVRTLEQFAEAFGPERPCSVAREISGRSPSCTIPRIAARCRSFSTISAPIRPRVRSSCW